MLAMLKIKLVEVVIDIWRRVGVQFAGTWVSKIPGVSRLHTYLAASILNGKTHEVDGQKMVAIFDPATKDLLYYTNNYEPLISSLFCSMLEEGMVVLDIGASLGYYTLLAAKRVGDKGEVIAFEPDPVAFCGLLENIRINGWKNVRAFQFAVSDSNGERKMGNLTAHKSFAIKNNTIGIITVNTISLDSFLDVDPDMIKIDVDGAELEVINGMKKILAKGKAKIICEVTPFHLSSLDYSAEKIEEILKQYNYNIYSITKSGLIPVTSFKTEDVYLFTREKVR
ncbi:MAG: FkbM family methyltransferase [Methanocellales archaeon]|nr:FkbM family methyltransferase [Methanocellales archaeon]MDD3291879.1 FkbM family methyltransferase [Methanocellales archaeon]MDD5235522.1 FkbM family methyltransferase [Methanocellales archaeon]MDD5485141.1 FkbM family methyltransferase [Methanocellales archaeon]